MAEPSRASFAAVTSSSTTSTRGTTTTIGLPECFAVASINRVINSVLPKPTSATMATFLS
nr:hypothetical protein [Exiguobacterium sp. LL15]